MQERLGQSWAGHVLRAMIAHEEARRPMAAHEARSVKDHERRLQRKQEQQLAQERRILLKKERDKRFWANARNDVEKNGTPRCPLLRLHPRTEANSPLPAIAIAPDLAPRHPTQSLPGFCIAAATK